MNINNIYCIGRNYKKHAEELGNAVPDQPLVFSKPHSSLQKADGRVVSFPNDKGEIHHELEIVLYVGSDVKEGFKTDDIITKMALGIDFTLRDVQSALKKKGHPWLIAKGFRNAAILTEFWAFPGEAKCQETDFSLLRNNKTIQEGNTKELIFDFQTLLEYVHEEIGLSKGDIIYTGTPEGVGPITNKEVYKLKWGDQLKGSFTVSKS